MTLPTKEPHINLDNKKKHELIAIIKRYRTNEGLLIQELQELKNEINEIKESLNQMKKSYKPHEGMENRTIAIEKRLAEQEQYSRRECIEIVGLSQGANGGELEDLVVETSTPQEYKWKDETSTLFTD